MSLPRLDAAALYRDIVDGTPEERDAALQTLGELLQRIVWSRVRTQPRKHHLAEECAQEALVVIWRHLEAGRGPEPVRLVSWSARIVVNKLLDEIRRIEPSASEHRTKRVALSRQTSLDAAPEPGGRTLGERLPDPEAEEMTERAAYAEVERVMADIEELEVVSEQSRYVLARGFLEGIEDQELADLLGTSRANIHVIRCRDLAKLREDPVVMGRLGSLYG